MFGKETFKNMKLKRLAVFSVCVIWGFVFCSVAAGEGKVGYINIQRLVNESKMGIAAKKEIERLQKKKEAVLSPKLKEIISLKKIMDTKTDNMDAKEKQGKTETLKQLQEEYQKLVNDAKNDTLKEYLELVSVILQKADDILKKVAKREKFSIIIKDLNAIGYMDPDFDITDMVLNELNESN